jgi:hypothetical protein
LYYLHKSRKTIRDAVARAQESREEIHKLAATKKEEEVKELESECMERVYFDGEAGRDAYPSPPESPSSTVDQDEQREEEEEAKPVETLTERLTRLLEVQKSPLLCGRRMFLASLISASKYLQDRNYSNKAWSKISGLDIKEINSNERAFLELVEWELHLKAEDFRRWTERLNCLTSSSSSSSASISSRQGLMRSSSEYLPPPPSSTSSIPTPSTTPRRSSNLVRSKLTLTRGNSAPHLDSTRSTGFPIAQPLSSRSQPAHPVAVVHEDKKEEAEEELEITEEEDNVIVRTPVVVAPVLTTSTSIRPVRALPLRRARLAYDSSSSSSGVPSTWGARTRFGDYGGRAQELVPVH